MAASYVPEVKLYLADDAVSLWQLTEEQLGELGLPPPFWAFAWAGGQALARYALDQPEIVRGKSVLDMASGSGLVAIAAMQAGAASALAADIDR
ncbi:MAG TPA: 50S ribosomal protein L11 methyltransferase, partial [Terricaulis sp.]|nr:50S ribosomal protein L11 methyltransferase [Terricaulis sp.]